jgi:hypothetical protein
MMTYLKSILLLVVVLLFSCEDHRMDGMEPDKVFLAKRGLVTESVYNIGETVTANYWTYKSGVGITTCTVEYQIDAAVLEQYNLENGTAYKLLPEDCYTLGDTRFTFSGKDLHAPFSFTYDPALIVEASGGTYETNEYALPIRIIPDGVELTNENLGGGSADQVIVVFNVKKPVLNILRDDFEAFAITAGETGTANYTFEAGMPFTSKWDISFGFSTDPQVLNNALNVYNTANGVSYELLGSDAYSILTENLTIPVGGDRIQVEFSIDRTEVDLGNFVLPLVLSDVSSPLLAGPDSMIFLPVRCVANRLTPASGWVATASTYNAQSPANLPRYIFDGDLTSYWHVVFKGQNGGLKDPDPWVMIDMNETKTICQVEIYPRYQGMAGVGVNNIDGYEIFTSETGTDGSWTGHGYHDASSVSDKSRSQFLFDLTEPTPARFVKVKITNNQPLTGGNTVGLMEVYLRGY